MRRIRPSKGFTIVELLIVMVVIAILAAISIVAYSGIRERALSAALQRDLINFSTILKLYSAENDLYPHSGVTDMATVTNGEYKVNTSLYATMPSVSRNLIYCSSATLDGYAILAKSTSGAQYMITDKDSTLRPLDSTWNNTTSAKQLCNSIGYTGMASTGPMTGYLEAAGNPDSVGWRPWTGASN